MASRMELPERWKRLEWIVYNLVILDRAWNIVHSMCNNETKWISGTTWYYNNQ